MERRLSSSETQYSTHEDTSIHLARCIAKISLEVLAVARSNAINSFSLPTIKAREQHRASRPETSLFLLPHSEVAIFWRGTKMRSPETSVALTSRHSCRNSLAA